MSNKVKGYLLIAPAVIFMVGLIATVAYFMPALILGWVVGLGLLVSARKGMDLISEENK